LIREASPEAAKSTIVDVARRLDLEDHLLIQSGFASIQGHRQTIGKHFMSVNERSAYQFIAPHSEGTRSMGIQLASFYCIENSTDGGETVLLNVDDTSAMWDILRELTAKVDLCGTQLSPAEVAGAKMIYQINIPADILDDSDTIVRERKSPIASIKCFDVLTKIRKTTCRILSRDLPVFWDSVGNVDLDSAKEYVHLLRCLGLVREPPTGLDVTHDWSNAQRVWSSGINYDSLFKARLTWKLTSGDLIVHNNLTWAHSCSNWTPGSGRRNVIAAFA
jgi:hypothetical protein